MSFLPPAGEWQICCYGLLPRIANKEFIQAVTSAVGKNKRSKNPDATGSRIYWDSTKVKNKARDY